MIRRVKKNIVVILLFILCFISLSMNIYLFNSYKKMEKILFNNIAALSNINRKLNTIELNNNDSWMELMKDKTGLDIKIPDDWSVESSYVKYEKDIQDNCYEFRIVFNMDGNYTFDKFADDLFDQAKIISYDYHESNVESWKDGKGYYPVNSFEETTYGNIYYDRSDYKGSSSALRHKVKIKRVDNQLILEVNKF